MAARSLRRRLLGLILGMTALAWLVLGAVSYIEARHEAEELLDAHLAQSAGLLLAQAGNEPRAVDTEHAPLLHRYARKAAFQIWEGGTRLRLHSANAPDVRFSPKEEGFSDATHGKARWRVFSAWDPQRAFLIQVGELSRARDEIVDSLVESLLLPLLGALPLLGVAIWFGIGRGLRPLAELRSQLAARGPDDLSPLPTGTAPEEVAPLVTELNRLFTRILQALERERRLTSDAAHELRTPLAVLSTQAQLARSAVSDAVRNEALEGLISGADRAARLAEQMLTLARLESGQTGGQRSRLDLVALTRAVVGEEAPHALAKRLDIAFECDQEGPVMVAGYAGLLGVLARNLLDNAIRYTPPGGRVRVTVRADSGRACLEVVDTGPGIPAQALPRLGERFYRVTANTEAGSGLGLSIVKRIAELHGGRVKVSPGIAGAGLTVVLELPLSTAITPPEERASLAKRA